MKQGGGLVMCGKPGTGKNHLAIGIGKLIIENFMASVRLTSAIKIARNFKATWAKDSEERESDVIEMYASLDLLIIDEVCVQFGNDVEKMILFEIINCRYENLKPTILISNLPKEELATFVGERVINRMNDGGGLYTKVHLGKLPFTQKSRLFLLLNYSYQGNPNEIPN
ncbi:ATP-binding protein [Arsenophonus endosymbiont of Aleurodicus floccissimus]|uniref:ATP-binding protein n=1 Tax=Arsenophonus endosymbiont of Aleurodicus floccissimus TaxID=2152761 RepID=UPI001EE060A0|nr:ATP-binding protein [Arsenophonus endosymbiont of Aleurodicus floccissimus]